MDAGFLDGDGPRTRGRSGAMKELRVVWRDQKSDNEDASNLEEWDSSESDSGGDTDVRRT